MYHNYNWSTLMSIRHDGTNFNQIALILFSREWVTNKATSIVWRRVTCPCRLIVYAQIVWISSQPIKYSNFFLPTTLSTVRFLTTSFRSTSFSRIKMHATHYGKDFHGYQWVEKIFNFLNLLDHLIIWTLSLQLTCGDICQIWRLWLMGGWCFGNSGTGK